jgi:hypothetical protein
MNTHEKRKAPSRTNSAWIIGLSVLCVGILGYKYLFSGNTISNPALLAGGALVYALVFTGLFSLIFLKWRSFKMIAIAFVAIYVSVFLGNLIAASHNKQQAPRAKVEQTAAATPGARGEAGEFARWLKEFLHQATELDTNYVRELEAIGWNSALDPGRIQNDTALSQTEVMIEQAKVIVDTYAKKSRDLYQEAGDHIKALQVSEATNNQGLADFGRALETLRPQLNESWQLEKEIVQQVEKMFEVLATSKGWEIQDGQMLFESDEDVARFNSHFDRIDAIVERQTEIRKSIDAGMNQKLKTLE